MGAQLSRERIQELRLQRLERAIFGDEHLCSCGCPRINEHWCSGGHYREDWGPPPLEETVVGPPVDA